MMLMLSPQFTESPIHSGFQAVSFKHVQGLQKEAEEYRGLQKKAEEYLVRTSTSDQRTANTSPLFLNCLVNEGHRLPLPESEVY